MRTSLVLTLVRTVTCLTLRIFNQAGRVSQFVYFSFFDFLFFGVVMVVRWAFDTLIKSLLLLLLVILLIISRIQHPLIVRREKLILQCKIFALRHPNNCVFFVCEFYAFTLKFTV